MPAKNAEKWIARALNSVVNQTDAHWNLQVLVDCSSSDATHANGTVFKSNRGKSRRNRRLVHVNVSQKPGLPNVYKELIDRAEPEDGICGFLDADDWLDPRAVGVVRSRYQGRPNLGCVWTQFWVDPIGSCGWSRPLPRDKGMREALDSGWWGAQHFRTFRKTTYVNSPYHLQLDVPYAADYNLALVLAASDCEAEFVNQRLYHYQRTPGGISQTKRAAQKANCMELGRRFHEWCGSQKG